VELNKVTENAILPVTVILTAEMDIPTDLLDKIKVYYEDTEFTFRDLTIGVRVKSYEDALDLAENIASIVSMIKDKGIKKVTHVINYEM